MRRSSSARGQPPSQAEILNRVLEGLTTQLNRPFSDTWGGRAQRLRYSHRTIVWGERYRNKRVRPENAQLHAQVVTLLDRLIKQWRKLLARTASAIKADGTEAQKKSIQVVQDLASRTDGVHHVELPAALERLAETLEVGRYRGPMVVGRQTELPTLRPGRVSKPGWQRDQGQQPESTWFVRDTAGRKFRN